jgi:hypothetical protein
MRSKTIVMLSVALVLTQVVGLSARAQTGDITVTATYKGKGTVDATHEILVFLFDHPNPTADSIPLNVQSITTNGGSATFKGLTTATPLYIVMVYDEKANYDGQSGPPPEGHPIGSYRKAGKPLAVTPGANVKVAAVFDDSERWGQKKKK